MPVLPQVLLACALILGTLMTLGSSHWFLAWMGLEISTLAVIPLVGYYVENLRSLESVFKYFLAQAAASSGVLFGCISNAWLTGYWDIHAKLHPLSALIIVTALAMKVGVAPLHMWLPDVLQGLPLPACLLLSTWQKFAPFALLLTSPLDSHTSLLVFGVLSILVGGWGGLNQTQLRKLLAYSSIAQLGWVLLVLQFSRPVALMVLLIYVTMTCSVFLILYFTNSRTLNMLALAAPKFPLLTTLLPLTLLSLGALPPLAGFFPKWLALGQLVQNYFPLVATLAALAGLLSLFYYLRICYTHAFTRPPNTHASITPWRFPLERTATITAFSTILSSFMMPLGPLLTALLSYVDLV